MPDPPKIDFDSIIKLDEVELEPVPKEIDYSSLEQVADDEIPAPRKAENIPISPDITEKILSSPSYSYMLDMAEDRQAELARLSNSHFFANWMNTSPGAVYKNYDTVAEHYFGTAEPMTNFKAIKRAYEVTNHEYDIGMLMFDKWMAMMAGKDISGIDAKVSELEATRKPLDEADRGLMMKFLLNAAEMAPYTVRPAAKGVKRGLGMGLGTAGAVGMGQALSGGKFAPWLLQSLGMGGLGATTSTAITALAIPMFAAGFKSGAIEENIKVMTGLSLYEMQNMTDKNGNPIDKRILLASTGAIGVINGLIEHMSVMAYLPGQGIGKQAAQELAFNALRKQVVMGSFKKIALGAASRYFGNITEENVEEIMQYIVEESVENFVQGVIDEANLAQSEVLKMDALERGGFWDDTGIYMPASEKDEGVFERGGAWYTKVASGIDEEGLRTEARRHMKEVWGTLGQTITKTTMASAVLSGPSVLMETGVMTKEQLDYIREREKFKSEDFQEERRQILKQKKMDQRESLLEDIRKMRPEDLTPELSERIIELEFIREDGSFIPTAKELGETQSLTIVGGPVGAGTTTALNEIDAPNTVIISPDRFKEYTENMAGNLHETASSLAKQTLAKAQVEGYHTIYDSSLGNLSLLDESIKRTLAEKGEVTIRFNNVDELTSFARTRAAQQIGKSTGVPVRNISDKAIRESYRRSLPTFLALYKKYQSQENVRFDVYDNSTDFKAPKPIIQNNKVVDQKALDALKKEEYEEIENGRRVERKEPGEGPDEKAINKRADAIANRQSNEDTEQAEAESRKRQALLPKLDERLEETAKKISDAKEELLIAPESEKEQLQKRIAKLQEQRDEYSQKKTEWMNQEETYQKEKEKAKEQKKKQGEQKKRKKAEPKATQKEISPYERWQSQFKEAFKNLSAEEHDAAFVIFEEMAFNQGLTADEMADRYMAGFTEELPSDLYQARPPFRHAGAGRRWGQLLRGRALDTYNLLQEVVDIGKVGPTEYLTKTGVPKSGTFNLFTDALTAEHFNKYLETTKGAREAAVAAYNRLGKDITDRMGMKKDGTLKVRALEKETKKLEVSFMQRVVDALPPETVPSSYHGINLSTTGGDSMVSVGGEAYRREILAEVRRQYLAGELATYTTVGTRSDLWGVLNWLQNNDKTIGSGDFTTLCPQMFFNKGCWYCYRFAGLESGVNAKLAGQRLWYTGDILKLTPEQVDQMNKMGGLRVQSFGDWLDPFASQLVDVLMDAEVVGLQLKVITKQVELIDLMDQVKRQNLGSNVFFNLSADYMLERMGEKNTEDYISWNQMRPFATKIDTKTDYWKRALSPLEAKEYRDKYPWVNVRIVAATVEHFIRGLMDPNVDVVTGYHGKISEIDVIDSQDGKHIVAAERVGEHGMPVFDENGEIVFEGREEVHKELAREIKERGLQEAYWQKSCCIHGQCSRCGALCGVERFKNSTEIKMSRMRDTDAQKYWDSIDSAKTDFLAQAEKGPIWIYKAETLAQEKIRQPMKGRDILQMFRKNGVKESEIQWNGLEEIFENDVTYSPENIAKMLEAARMNVEDIILSKEEKKQPDKVVAGLPAEYTDEEYDVLYVGDRRIDSLMIEAGVRNDDTTWEGIDMWAHETYAVDNDSAKNKTELLKYIDFLIEVGESDIVVLKEEHAKGEMNEEIEIEYREREVEATKRLRAIVAESEEEFRAIRGVSPGEEEIDQVLDEREGRPRYEHYVLPNGMDYGEILLRLPFPLGEYSSPHWETPNVLVHVRHNRRNGVEDLGYPHQVLFIEEIQSDWHQAGRERGYAERALKKEQIESYLEKGYLIYREKGSWDFLVEMEDVGGIPIVAIQTDYEIENASQEEAAKIEEQALEHIKNLIRRDPGMMDRALGRGVWSNTGKVPDAPFKKTQEWVGLALKRMIRYAVENGFESVAWTTGLEQAERYNLAKYVDKIEARKIKKGPREIEIVGDQELYYVKVHGTADQEFNNQTYDDLKNLLGKEFADKIVKDTEGLDPENTFIEAEKPMEYVPSVIDEMYVGDIALTTWMEDLGYDDNMAQYDYYQNWAQNYEGRDLSQVDLLKLFKRDLVVNLHTYVSALEKWKHGTYNGQRTEAEIIAEIDAHRAMLDAWEKVDETDLVVMTTNGDVAQNYNPTGQEWASYSDTDLTIGGEGHKTFYDKVIPSVASKLIKKFGLKIEPIAVDIAEKPKPKPRYVENPNGMSIDDFVVDSVRELGIADESLIEPLQIDIGQLIHGHEVVDIREWKTKLLDILAEDYAEMTNKISELERNTAGLFQGELEESLEIARQDRDYVNLMRAIVDRIDVEITPLEKQATPITETALTDHQGFYINDELRDSVMGGQYLFQADFWHGTNQVFQIMDISKVGTGQGSAARGWGIYVSQLKRVAEYYSENVSRWQGITKTVHKINGKMIGEWVAEAAKDYQFDTTRLNIYGNNIYKRIEAAIHENSLVDQPFLESPEVTRLEELLDKAESLEGDDLIDVQVEIFQLKEKIGRGM
jgi:hypothetical protein